MKHLYIFMSFLSLTLPLHGMQQQETTHESEQATFNESHKQFLARLEKTHEYRFFENALLRGESVDFFKSEDSQKNQITFKCSKSDETITLVKKVGDSEQVITFCDGGFLPPIQKNVDALIFVSPNGKILMCPYGYKGISLYNCETERSTFFPLAHKINILSGAIANDERTMAVIYSDNYYYQIIVIDLEEQKCLSRYVIIPKTHNTRFIIQSCSFNDSGKRVGIRYAEQEFISAGPHMTFPLNATSYTNLIFNSSYKEEIPLHQLSEFQSSWWCTIV